MLTMAQQRPELTSRLVDLAWQALIPDTAAYKHDCLRLAGFFLDHAPAFGAPS